MTKVFNEINVVINDAMKRGDSPGDLLAALTGSILGVINCLRVTDDVKSQLREQAAGMINGK